MANPDNAAIHHRLLRPILLTQQKQVNKTIDTTAI
jgi:hypothetical protein